MKARGKVKEGKETLEQDTGHAKTIKWLSEHSADGPSPQSTESISMWFQ